MCHLKVFRQKYPLSRFGELFVPTVLNFSFWLATAVFWFFAYQSLLPSAEEANMSLAQRILPDVFLWFGYFCLGVIVYLFITWLLGIRITKTKTNEENITDIKRLTKELQDLEKKLGKVLGKVDDKGDESTTKNE